MKTFKQLDEELKDLMEKENPFAKKDDKEKDDSKKDKDDKDTDNEDDGKDDE